MAASLEPLPFAPRCLSIDLEVGRGDGRIHKFAAVRGDTGAALHFTGGDLHAALARLDEFAADASFLLGHNLSSFDRPHLQAIAPDLRLLSLPDVDTLRLNPLAFPRNPYHHLVKDYQDGALKRGQLNDPELDARLTLQLFGDQRDALIACHARAPDLVRAWHWLTTQHDGHRGFDTFFATIRRQPRPKPQEAQAAIASLLDGQACTGQVERILEHSDQHGWPLAYVLAWLAVAGGNSVMPPWVRHQFPEAGNLVRQLRDTPCQSADCRWCREHHDAVRELTRWFGFPGYRFEPADADGNSLQQSIVEAAMGGEHVLGILPTGTGKSVCYQIPALSRYHKTGALTVVISPLVALMADQVAGMEARGLTSCAAVNGLLSWPERVDVLDRVRLGDVAILIISPEQLRNRAVRRVLLQREIGAWVLDEAHCLSKWGHDFRPDYRYVGRFIRERAGEDPVPPVLCLTATAKIDVVADIRGHFRDKLGIDLVKYDGGTKRTNLDFEVVGTSQAEKLAHIHQVLEHDLGAGEGGAIVYCSARRRTEETAQYLREKGWAADFFHARLPPETKKDVQRRFIHGELRVIVATNAFGMGIDKPDVRLVVHADMPGSLENYLQEAGRAGRDQHPARCVLLYTPEDIEFQFGLSARSRLTRREIAAILKAIRRLDRKKRFQGEVVATPGEILLEEEEGAFERETTTDDTRVRTAVAWLEEAALLKREENRVQMFPSSLRVASVEEAKARLDKRDLFDDYRQALLKLVTALIDADPDEGISTDELMGLSGLGAEEVRKALFDLETLGIASNDMAITAFVHDGVERASRKRLEEAVALESDLIELLQEAAPDLEKGESESLHLRVVTQHLKDRGHANALPEMVWRLVRSLSGDGRDEVGGVGSIDVKRLDAETSQIKLNRDWRALAKTAERRRSAAAILLDHLLECLPDGARGTDLLAETTLGKLRAALETDLLLTAESRDVSKLLDRALLWLHEQEVIRLNKGLAVFRPAMTLRLAEQRRGFHKADFEPLRIHYQEQVVQIHVMAEFVRRGMATMADALQLAMDYFGMERDRFIGRWLPNRERELKRQTTPDSWHAIVESLGNPVQQRIVADDREQTNVLVLAGPGSGKTRVLVHRIAYLLRVRRERPSGILALAYNRHAAVEIRRRLKSLVGDDARGVTIMTCHALAMRLTGMSFAHHLGGVGAATGVAATDGGGTAGGGKAAAPGGSGLQTANPDQLFKEALIQATNLLRGTGLPPEDADEQRARLLGGFRWILVDEYQDVGPEQYELIAALAGRTFADEDGRLTLFAVGDDDQNIYGFAGASVEFIRRFETDYDARIAYLVENYRSTANIIDAANHVIAESADRMKADHPIVIDQRRRDAPAGGLWESLDPVAEGKVQLLPAGPNPMTQAVAVMTELERLATLDPEWDWSTAAVIARQWKYLEPVRAYCELHGIPAQMAHEQPPHFWRLRETQALIDHLRAHPEPLMRPDLAQTWLDQQPPNPWYDLLREAADAYALEVGNAELPTDHFFEWLAEWGREARRRQTGLLLLTAHRAKGLEFDHVAVLDGTWLGGSGRPAANPSSSAEDPDTPRRLYYVAMTRARQSLTLATTTPGATTTLVGAAARPRTSLLPRNPRPLPTPPPDLARRHVPLTLGDVDLDFAGRRGPAHPIHTAIAALNPGDPLTLRYGASGTEILTRAGVVVGRLARRYRPPEGMRCSQSIVTAVVQRRREDSTAEYAHRIAAYTWEVVVPELTYEP